MKKYIKPEAKVLNIETPAILLGTSTPQVGNDYLNDEEEFDS